MPVAIVSTGSDRDETIVREDRLAAPVVPASAVTLAARLTRALAARVRGRRSRCTASAFGAGELHAGRGSGAAVRAASRTRPTTTEPAAQRATASARCPRAATTRTRWLGLSTNGRHAPGRRGSTDRPARAGLPSTSTSMPSMMRTRAARARAAAASSGAAAAPARRRAGGVMPAPLFARARGWRWRRARRRGPRTARASGRP